MELHLQKGEMALTLTKPLIGYRGARFDWTGKICSLKYQDQELLSFEKKDDPQALFSGGGLYNEFGIDDPLGFEEAPIGGWFHKIGIGLLKKTEKRYHFLNVYKIQPAQFELEQSEEAVLIRCSSEKHLGYAYILEKEFRLLENGLTVTYCLQNKGDLPIETEEYAHNFLGFNQHPLGPDYSLKFNFTLDPSGFGELLNPDGILNFQDNRITFNHLASEQFFVSQLNGNWKQAASWELKNTRLGIAFQESLDQPVSKVNLWGSDNVLSPELFCPIKLEHGAQQRWSRHYKAHRFR